MTGVLIKVEIWTRDFYMGKDALKEGWKPWDYHFESLRNGRLPAAAAKVEQETDSSSKS